MATRPKKADSVIWEAAENVRAITEELEELVADPVTLERIRGINRSIHRWARESNYPFLSPATDVGSTSASPSLRATSSAESLRATTAGASSQRR